MFPTLSADPITGLVVLGLMLAGAVVVARLVVLYVRAGGPK